LPLFEGLSVSQICERGTGLSGWSFAADNLRDLFFLCMRHSIVCATRLQCLLLAESGTSGLRSLRRQSGRLSEKSIPVTVGNTTREYATFFACSCHEADHICLGSFSLGSRLSKNLKFACKPSRGQS
jgi:hypothetical protein